MMPGFLGMRSFIAWRRGLRLVELDRIVFYDKPLIKFERLLEAYVSYAPSGFRSFVTSMPAWLKETLYLKSVLRRSSRSSRISVRRSLPYFFFHT
jgi:carbamoyltransferase